VLGIAVCPHPIIPVIINIKNHNPANQYLPAVVLVVVFVK
jgi:hypothetical protein